MRSYSTGLRDRVLADCDAGTATRQAAATFRGSESWVRRVRQRTPDKGEIAPRDGGHGPGPSWGGYADRLRRATAADPDATLKELKARLGLTAAPSALWRAVASLGPTVQKRRPGRPSRTART